MLQVETAPINTPKIVGFDTIARLDWPKAKSLAAAGLTFALSYVSLRPGLSGPLDAEQLDVLTAAGFRVMPVQYARTRDWSAATGQTDGAAAASNARAAGIPAGCTLWCDLEGAIPNPDVAVAYANAWANAALAGGAEDPGIYIGAGVPLTGQELYDRLAFKRYWRSFSAVPDIAKRGYQMLQLFPGNQIVAGVQVDLDVIQTDYLGDRPRWALAA